MSQRRTSAQQSVNVGFRYANQTEVDQGVWQIGCQNCPFTIKGMTICGVRLAQPSDRNQLAQMWALLWPDASFDEHRKELD